MSEAERKDAIAIAMFAQITRAKLAFLAELRAAGVIDDHAFHKWTTSVQEEGLASIEKIGEGALDTHPTGNRSSLGVAGAFGLFRLLELNASEVVSTCHAIIHAALAEANMKGLVSAAQRAAQATREASDDDLPIM